MEQLLSYSQRMRYAQAKQKRPAVPISEHAKVVIITPSIRIPRSIRCEIDSDGKSIYQDKPDVDDMDDIEFLNRHRQSQTSLVYGDDD